MDFIRKNWSRLSIALLFLLGGILGIVAFANSGLFKLANDAASTFYYIAMLTSVIVYFFGMVCVMILKSCAGKKAVSMAYMVMGAIVAILNLVVLFVCINDASKISLIGANAVDVFFRFIVVTLVFGFYPLIKGITRFIEAEMTPLPAKAAPAQPATTAAPAQATATAPKAKTATATAAKKPASKTAAK